MVISPFAIAAYWNTAKCCALRLAYSDKQKHVFTAIAPYTAKEH